MRRACPPARPTPPTRRTPAQNLGIDWDERVLPSIGNEVLKAVVAQYAAEQLLTKRDQARARGLGGAALRPLLCTAPTERELERMAPPAAARSPRPPVHSPAHLTRPPSHSLRPTQVSAQVRDGLTKRANEFNILVDDVAITHLSFGTEFTKAVESKQVAQQEAERARFVVMKADQVCVWGGGGVQ